MPRNNPLLQLKETRCCPNDRRGILNKRGRSGRRSTQPRGSAGSADPPAWGFWRTGQAGNHRPLLKEVNVPILLAVVQREVVGFRVGVASDLLIAQRRRGASLRVGRSGRALVLRRLLRPLAATSSLKGTARRRVDALVAVVPADSIAR